MLTSLSEQSTPPALSTASVLIRPPRKPNSTRPSWVKPKLPPSPTTLACNSLPLIRNESFALSPTSRWLSFELLTYVPIPPFHNKSTFIFKMACIRSIGDMVCFCVPSILLICGVNLIDFT